MRTRIVALFVSALGAAVSCAQGAPEDTRRALLASWGSYLVDGLYAEFEASTEVLDQKVNALCALPSDVALEEARGGWREARAPWKRAEGFAFGPYKKEPHRFGIKIDFWPARSEIIDEMLASDQELTLDTVKSFGTVHAGMPVLEYLLFQPGIDHLAELASDPRRCQYLTGLSADLLADARGMHDAWHPDGDNYLNELQGAGVTSEVFTTLQEAMTEVVNRLGWTVENIRLDKLGRPLGQSTSDGTPSPEMAESRFSGRSIEDIGDNLTGLEVLFFGGDSPEQLGLDDYLIELGTPLTAQAEQAFGAVRERLDAITVPLTTAVSTEPEKVQGAIDALTDLQLFLQVDVASLLSVTIGFNDTDGD